MNYTVIEKKPVELSEGVMQYIVTILADTEEDIPAPQPGWLPGSLVLIADPHGYRLLNTENAWK